MSTDISSPATRPRGSAAVGKGLKGGALGLVSTVVIGMACTAPAYSLAASLGFVVVLAGEKAPAILLLAFVPMFFIALAFRELNSAEPDCGTSFFWAARAFGPWAGWITGWGLLAALIIVLTNLAQVAGQYSFLLFGATELAESTFWTTVAGVVWILVTTYICHRGIDISARVQYVMLGIELVLLASFALVALVRVYGGIAPEGSLIPSLSWLWPDSLAPRDLIDAVLIAIFLYWGWDTAVSCSEETDRPTSTPGRAAVLSTVLLVLTYVTVATATVAFAGVGTEGIGLGNEDNSDDVFAAVAPAVFGDSPVGHFLVLLLIICVLTSSAASTQTTILPAARVALSMATVRAIPKQFAAVHPRHQTPSFATWATGLAACALYVGLTVLSANVLSDTIAAVGLLIAFYYGITGVACVWYFRRRLRGRDLLMKGVLPGLGGLALLTAFVLSAVDYWAEDAGETTVLGVGGVFVIGIGSLLVGAVLMMLCNRLSPRYFRGDTLPVARARTAARSGSSRPS